MSIIFQKVYRPFFTHTHTTSSSSNTQFSYVFVISTTQHSRSVQMWVKPCFASTPSIHGGGASVHTLAFFFIRNTHTHTHAHPTFSFHAIHVQVGPQHTESPCPIPASGRTPAQFQVHQWALPAEHFSLCPKPLHNGPPSSGRSRYISSCDEPFAVGTRSITQRTHPEGTKEPPQFTFTNGVYGYFRQATSLPIKKCHSKF